MITMLIVVFIVLAGMALLWWGVSRLPLPEPVKTVVLVVLGLVCLIMIYQFVVGGGIAKLT